MSTTFNAKRRYFHVYRATVQILLRYACLNFLKKVVGEERMQKLYLVAHRKSSEQIIAVVQTQRGLFIKIGQTLSVMSHVLPEALTSRLEMLQDSVPAHAFAEIRERIIHDLGETPETLFARIDEKPLASASLAQVHVAYLHSGEKVAVKVQYPGIEEVTHHDLKVLRRIFGWLDFLFPGLNLQPVYQECEEILLEELDYRHEAHNITKMTNNFLQQDQFVFPKVYEKLSSDKVLTLSFVEGVKVNDLSKLASQAVDRKVLCQDVLHFFCKQIFVDGVYHADPHPGNIIITPSGQVALIDFGAVAQISPQMRQGLTDFVEGLIKRDSRLLSQALKKMGFIAKKSDDETLDTVVEYFYSKFSALKIDNFKNLDLTAFHNLEDLVELKKLDISFRELASLFSVPKEWILLERTLLILSGLAAQLDEHHNPMQTVIPYVETFLLGPNKNLHELITQAGKELLTSYLNLPHQLERTLKKLNQGQVSLKVQGLNEELARTRKTMTLLSLILLIVAGGGLTYFLAPTQLEMAQRFEILTYLFSGVFIFRILRN